MLLIIGVFVAFTVYADSSPKYSVQEWNISAVINPDGSMDVEEYITYDVKHGHQGPVVRHIDISNSSSMENLEVLSVKSADTEDSTQSKLEPYKFVDKPDGGITRAFATRPGDIPDEIEDVLIFPPDGGEHTFVLKYRLNDLVSLYKDTAVLYWNPVIKGYGLEVHKFNMNITLPEGTKPDGLKPFVYGALEGGCEVLEDGTASITVTRLSAGEFVEVTLVFPKDGVTQGRKVIDNDGLNSILQEQSMKAEEMELLRRKEEKERKLRFVAVGGAIAGIIIIMICAWAWVGKRCSKSSAFLSFLKGQAYAGTSASGLDGAVTRQLVNVYGKSGDAKQEVISPVRLPADYYTPAELGALLRGRKIVPADMVATLIDLAVRNYLDIEVSGEGCYVLTLRDFKRDSLKSHEEYLINWFFKDIGDGKKVSTGAILQAAYGGGFGKEFHNRFLIWKKLVLRQAMRWGFNKRVPFFKAYKRTPFGKQHYKNWIRFKKELKRLSREAYKLPLKDWESFLAYAFTLGIARYVVEGLHKAYPYSVRALLNSDLAVLRPENFVAIDHWLDLAKRLNLMRFKRARILSWLYVIKPLSTGRSYRKSDTYT
nr:DUF2207 domain-containing protein [Caldicoprobacter guelmensis]